MTQPETNPSEIPSYENPQLLWHTVMERANKMSKMLSKQILYFIENSRSTTFSPKIFLEDKTFGEFLNIHQAAISRALKQNENWIDGWMGVIQKYKDMKNVNTLSKYVEQEHNIVAQCGNLVNKQISGWTGLLENIQVDYAYWLSQKKEEQTES